MMIKHLRIIISVLVIQFLVVTNSYGEEKQVKDCFEKINRVTFAFNMALDKVLFRPVAVGYRKLPSPVRTGTNNALVNLSSLVTIPNNVLQRELKTAGVNTGRFIINTTIGIFGLFDVATKMGFSEYQKEDYGQTLAVWGVPDGPYVMLPIFGPSSVRDSVGMGVDAVTNPLSFAYRMNSIGLEARLSGPVVRGVSTREKYLDYVDEMKAGSLDWYATMRSLYRQKRKKEISGQLENEKVSFDLIPTDVYEDTEIVNLDKKIANEVKTELSKTELVKDVKVANKRYYNGILPSSNYPGFNESRVNLIE